MFLSLELERQDWRNGCCYSTVTCGHRCFCSPYSYMIAICIHPLVCLCFSSRRQQQCMYIFGHIIPPRSVFGHCVLEPRTEGILSYINGIIWASSLAMSLDFFSGLFSSTHFSGILPAVYTSPQVRYFSQTVRILPHVQLYWLVTFFRTVTIHSSFLQFFDCFICLVMIASPKIKNDD